MTKVYVAGPMTGIPQFNIPQFDEASSDLRSRGFEVVNPADEDGLEVRTAALASPDGDPAVLTGLVNQTHGDFLARDVKIIADEGIMAIYVLPGWHKSSGARHETFVGYLKHIPVICYVCDEVVPIGSLMTAWLGEGIVFDRSHQ